MEAAVASSDGTGDAIQPKFIVHRHDQGWGVAHRGERGPTFIVANTGVKENAEIIAAALNARGARASGGFLADGPRPCANCKGRGVVQVVTENGGSRRYATTGSTWTQIPCPECKTSGVTA